MSSLLPDQGRRSAVAALPLVERRGFTRGRAVMALVLFLAVLVLTFGLPGHARVQVTLSYAGGPAVVGTSGPVNDGGRFVVSRFGHVFSRVTVAAGDHASLKLRPGLYSLAAAGNTNCGRSIWVWPGATRSVAIICSVP